MIRNPKEHNYFDHPDFGSAIRWLREQRRDWTRKQLLDAIKSQSDISISNVYLTKLERGERGSISKDKLAAILKALGSNQQELEALLEQRPWESQTSSRRRVGSTKESLYQTAATNALAELNDNGTWSSTVEDPSEQKKLQGQAVELVEHFVKLSAAERMRILKQVRDRRQGHVDE